MQPRPFIPLRPLKGHTLSAPEIDPMSQRRFPPPWSVEEQDARLVVRYRGGHLLRYNNEAAPRQGAAFLFMLFARQADSAEPCARRTLYVPFDFFLDFFFMTFFLGVDPPPNRNNANRQMNAA